MADADLENKIVSGEVWEQFCDTLKNAGKTIMSAGAPDDVLNRAEGFRYLSRITRAALETFVEYNDPLAPELRRVIHETAKMGSDNPDNFYQNATISGDHDYRISGNRGTVNYLGFYTQKGGYGEGRGLPPTGAVEAKDLDIDDDGTFELVLSCEEKSGNWLPMEKETGLLMVRQTFLDRDSEVPAELTIERVGGDGKATEFSPTAFAQGLTKSAMLTMGASMLFKNWAEGFKKHKNTLPRFDPEVNRQAGGDDNIAYYHSYWEVAPDEALVIEAMPPQCDHWNFQLNNYWMESLDYRHYNIHVNKHTARYRPDGSVVVVVAHEDRGFDNWINTVGHSCGTMCWRWVRASDNPEPKTKLVKLSEL